MCRRIFYCHLAACPTAGNNRYMIAPNLPLPVPPIRQRLIHAVIATADLTDNAVPDVADEGGILYEQVRHDVPVLPAHILDVSLGVCRVVHRPHTLHGMIAGHVLSLEAGQGGRIKHIRLIPIYRHQPVRVSLQLQLGGLVGHLTRPGYGYIPADKVALRRVRHVGRDLGTIVGKHCKSPRKMKRTSRWWFSSC